MANTEAVDIKQKLDHGLMDMAGLISRRDYNLSLVKARQTAEQIVRELASENRIEYTDLAETIESIYKAGIIDRTSRDSLHSIRLYGNKAVHEGDNDLEDARQAYYLLKTEIQTYNSRNLVNTDRTPIRVSGRSQTAHEAQQPVPGRQNGSEEPDIVPAGRRGGQNRPQQRRSGSSSQGRPGKKVQRSGKSAPASSEISLSSILQILIPVIALILVVILLKNLFTSRPAKETTAELTTTAAEVQTTAPVRETEAPTTEAPTTAAVISYQVKVSEGGVNVRLADDQSRIWTQLKNGDYIGPVTEIAGSDYVQFTMDGKKVVISKKFITPVQ